MITISRDRAWNALRAIAAVAFAGVISSCGGGGGAGGDPVPQAEPVPGYASALVVDPKAAISINGYPSAPNILLVRFKTGVMAQDMASTIAAAGGRVVGQIPRTMLVQAQFDGDWTDARANALIAQLTSVPLVAGVTLDQFNVANAAPDDPWRSPNSPPPDPLDPPLWDGRFDTGRNWRIKAIRAEVAWERLRISGRQLSKVTMGVLDNGFREGHEDLQNLKTLNLQWPDGAGKNHGMHVAGIMAAVGDNARGIAGIAWTGNHTILAYDFLGATDFMVQLGMEVLLSSPSGPVKVINISAGRGYQDHLLDNELKPGYAWLPDASTDRKALKRKLRSEALAMFTSVADKDALIVQAAGNAHIDAAYGGWAASALWDDPDDAGELVQDLATLNITAEDLKTIRSKLLVVGATYPLGADTLASTDYSNYGKVVEVWAPGGVKRTMCPVSYCRILSTGYDWDYVDTDKNGNLYVGTSMAAPHIAGLAGLLWQINPDLGAAQVKNLILLRSPNGAERTANVGHAPIDNGVVANADFAVDEALRFDNRAPIALFVTSQSGSDIVFSAASSIDPDGDAIASFAWTLRDSAGWKVAEGSEANFRVAQRQGAYTISLRVTDSVGSPSALIEQTVSLSGTPLPVVAVPSVTSVSPTTMVADGVTKVLTIDGSSFTNGNVVQFRWGVGPGAGKWIQSAGAISSRTSARIVVPLNPGKVADAINVRVCRSASLASDSDCTSGAAHSVTVSPVLAAGPDLVVQDINFSPMEVFPGDVVQLTFAVTNRGTASAAGSSAGVRFDLSSSSEAGPVVGGIGVPSLTAGASTTVKTNVPAPVTPGIYRFWVIVGIGNTAGSINAGVAPGTLTVVGTPPPPPMVTSVSVDPTSPAVGDRATFSVIGTNLGINPQSGFAFSFPGCAATELSSTNPTFKWFTCTLTQAGSNLVGHVTSASGVLLYAFTLSVAVNSTAPSQTATITQVLDDVGASTGPLAQGATTDDTTPTLGGILSAALTATQTLRVFTGNTILGAATVSGTNWSVTPTALANGLYSFAAAVVSVDGIEGTRSAAWNLTVNAPPPSPPPINGMRIAAGWNHTCAITPVGGVKCWGLNQWGQLGDGTVINRLTPVSVVGLDSGVVAVAASANAGHTCALTNTGSLWCWGLNDRGQLGDSTTVTRRTPVNVTGLGSGVLAVSAGYQYTCALTAGGAVKCWGANAVGQLGDGTQAGALLPVSVLGLQAGVVGISLSHTHACAVTSTGSVKCWGSNDRGELGDGSTSLRLAPVDTLGMTSGVAAVSTGNVHTCIVSMSGGVQCRGAGLSGELGDGTGTNSAMPVAVLGLGSGVTAIASSSHTCALASTGALRCWGPNFSGGLGDGTSIDRFAPIAVVGLSSGVTEITVGLDYTCALMGTGSIKCWGHNGAGQLGDGTTSDRYVPVDVVGF